MDDYPDEDMPSPSVYWAGRLISTVVIVTMILGALTCMTMSVKALVWALAF